MISNIAFSIGNHLDDDSRVVIRIDEGVYKNSVISFNRLTLHEKQLEYQVDLLTCVNNGVTIDVEEIPPGLLALTKDIIREVITENN